MPGPDEGDEVRDVVLQLRRAMGHGSDRPPLTVVEARATSDAPAASRVSADAPSACA
jgi:hypothetical protein